MVDMSQQHRHLQEEERSNLIPVWQLGKGLMTSNPQITVAPNLRLDICRWKSATPISTGRIRNCPNYPVEMAIWRHLMDTAI